ncbi:MAG: hypothetical protein HMLKMBBP_02653 [Planctomycetes bacterium]|nr:hypothetical protein [Planctomycetota bacterium]
MARDVARRHGLAVAGEAPGLAERFYVITTDRRIRHPAVEALLAGARKGLFGPNPAA